MHELRLLLAAIGLERRLHHAKEQAGRGAVAAGLCLAFLIAFATVITGLLAAALYWLLLSKFGPAGAAAATGAVFAILLITAVFFLLRSMRAPAAVQPAVPAEGLAGGDLAELLAPQNLRGLATLAVLGLVLGLTQRGTRRE